MSEKQFTKTVEVAEELESQKCKVTISGKEYLYEKGTSYQEIAKDFQKEYKHQIALVMLDGHRLQELRKQVSGDCTLQLQHRIRRGMTRIGEVSAFFLLRQYTM